MKMKMHALFKKAISIFLVFAIIIGCMIPNSDNGYFKASAATLSTPLLSVDSPLNNPNISANLTVSGWGLDSCGIKEIDFYLDGVFYGSTTTTKYRPDVYAAYPSYNNYYSGFSFSINNSSSLASGTHSIKVTAVGTDGGTKSSTISFNKLAMHMSLDSPLTTTYLTDQLVVRGWSLDSSGIKEVDIYLDDTLIGKTDTGIEREDVYNAYPDYNDHYSGYRYTLTNSSSISCGSHTLKVVCVAADGETRTSPSVTIIKANPEICVDYPLDGTTLNSDNNLNVRGWALNSNGVKEVDVCVDSKAYLNVPGGLSRPDVDEEMNTNGQYLNADKSGFNVTINKAEVSVGSHTITIKSIGNDNSISSAKVTVSVYDGTSPSVPINLTSTTQRSTSVTLSWAPSTDNVGVTGYKIYKNGALLGTTSNTSYSDSGLTINQTYTYTVASYDVAGNTSAQSSGLKFTPDFTAPVLCLSSSSTWGDTNDVTADITENGSGIASEKYAIGDLPISFFSANGSSFTGNGFTVSKNGVYTIYAKDNAGNESVKTVTVNHVLQDLPIGNYSQSFSDMNINSTGMSIDLGRTYNSLDNTTGDLGRGWRLSYQGSCRDYQYAYTDTDGSTKTASLPSLKIVSMPDGSNEVFLLVNGIYMAYNSTDTLSQNSQGNFILKTSDQISYLFNSNGYLASITDKNGNTISINVDANGRINSVTDTAGRVYTYTYASDTVTLADKTGRTVIYNLTNGMLSSVIDPMNRMIGKYGYDASGYLSSIRDGSNNILASVSYDHSASDRVISSTDDSNNTINYLYNDTENSVTSTNTSNQQSTTSWYNNANQIVKFIDEYDSKTFYIYDNTGNLLKEITPLDDTDEYSNSADQSLFDFTIYTYDANSNITNISYPDGTSETYTYDDLNDVLTQKDKDGTMTYFKYDNSGNQTIKAVRKSGTEDYSDALTDEQRRDFDITSCTYLSNGLLSMQTNPDGTTISYSNYENGNAKTVTSSSTGTTTYEYNSLGWATKETAPDGKATITDYNKNEQAIRKTVGSSVTRYIYDPLGRLVQQIDPAYYLSANDGLNNDPATDTYSDSDVGIRYTYDQHGNVLTKTDAANNVTAYAYDSHNRVIKIEYNNKDVTRYIYNLDGKLIQQINPDQYDAAKDEWNGTDSSNTYSDNAAGYRFVYDDNGNLQTETYPNGQAFHYDSDGKVSSVDNASGAAISGVSYTYDVNGNIQTISENGTQKVKYYYDTDSQLVREDNAWENQTIVYAYDSRGNIRTKTIYAYTTDDTIAAAASYVCTYGYDDTANPDTLDSYDGKSITYDDNGNITGFDGWSYTWDGKNLSTLSNGATNVSYQYTYDGYRTQKTINGIATSYTLDANNNVTGESDGTDTITYSRDIDGNLLSMALNGAKYNYERNSQGDITGLLDSSGNEVVTYSYDSWGKLLSIGGSLKDTVGVKNPFRYRSYYYDTETGLYYLQSRYYNPELGRFISKDDPKFHIGESGIKVNLFSYVDNNPVINSDPTGFTYAIGSGGGGHRYYGMFSHKAICRHYGPGRQLGLTENIYYFYCKDLAYEFADDLTVSNIEATFEFCFSSLIGIGSSAAGVIFGAVFLINSNGRTILASRLKKFIRNSRSSRIKITLDSYNSYAGGCGSTSYSISNF